MLIVVMHVANPQWLLLLRAPLYADLINSVMVAGHLSDKFSVYIHIKIKKTLIAVYLFFVVYIELCAIVSFLIFLCLLKSFSALTLLVGWLVS